MPFDTVRARFEFIKIFQISNQKQAVFNSPLEKDSYPKAPQKAFSNKEGQFCQPHKPQIVLTLK